MPVARIPLSAAVIALALSPKSNSAEIAIDNAINDIRYGKTGDVPVHLHNGCEQYKYPHDYPNDYVKQQYLPNEIKHRIYYIPKNNTNEKLLKAVIDNLSKIK